MYSVITPVYRNAESLPLLVSEFARLNDVIQLRFGVPVEFIFVVDASPDESYALLEELLPSAPFRSQLILHARNFGSFAAIRTGLQAAHGDYYGIVAADLQEPPEILVSFLEVLLSGSHDIVVGVREARSDSAGARAAAELFWWGYRRFVFREIPAGGADIFGCNRKVRDELLKLEEAHSSLVGQIYWLGFRKAEVGYARRPRAHGKSAWTLRKKFAYLLDSIFAFTELPIIALTLAGFFGLVFAVALGLLIVGLRLVSPFPVPGYAALMVVIVFFGALNMLGLGLIGAYTWRAYENTKRRPLAVVQSARSFTGDVAAAQRPSELQETG
jgi:glycosyltransferase involved in cell wall biosynthesis